MKSILIVDDDKTNLISAKSALEGLYKVIAVPSGVQALKFLENNVCDLILLDVEMPLMNGLDTLKEIRARENGKSIPVIFLTANQRRETVIEAMKLGIKDYLTKPFVHQELRDRVEKVFKKEGSLATNEDIIECLSEVLEDLRSSRSAQAISKIETMLNFLKS